MTCIYSLECSFVHADFIRLYLFTEGECQVMSLDLIFFSHQSRRHLDILHDG
jgi:hypothetical protein